MSKNKAFKVLAVLLIIASLNFAVATIVFNNQTPSDINSFNIINADLNITYNTTGDVKNNSAFLYSFTNSSLSNCTIIVNGSYDCGNYSSFYSRKANTSVTTITGGQIYLFNKTENDVYPTTYNLNEKYYWSTPRSTGTLSSSKHYVLTVLHNVSAQEQYSFLEIMVNNSGPLPIRIYYCNASYAIGNPTTNPNCADIYNIPAGLAWNHSHSPYESHMVVPFAINTTSGTIEGVKVTEVSQFLIRGQSGASTVKYYYLTDTTRMNTTQTTTNDGASWTNQTYTVDLHLHQYNGSETFNYFACVNDSLDVVSCTVNQIDLIDEGNLPPNPPVIYSPLNTTYYTYVASLIINYSEAMSPNAYAMSYYNITLYNEDGTFNMSIAENNSLNLNYTWYPASNITSGDYRVGVTACDINSECSEALSELFYLERNLMCDQTLDIANTVYNLSNDTSIYGATCFNVTAQNVTLNCAGYDIVGDNSTGTYGVYSNQFNTTIRNCNISNFGEAIRFSGATDGLIQNNTLETTQFGIDFEGSALKFVSNAHRNTIIGNAISTGNASGIYVDSGNNNSITCSGLNIVGSGYAGSYGIWASGANTTIRDCNISNYNAGVVIDYTENCTVENVTVNVTGTTSMDAGVWIYNGAKYNRVNNVTVFSQTDVALLIYNSHNNSIGNSTGISVTGLGCMIYDSTGNDIKNTNCTSMANSGASFQSDSYYNTYENCSVNGYEDTYGAFKVFDYSENNTIANCTINGMGAAKGIDISTSIRNLFINNTISNATDLLTLSIESGANTFYWNNFTTTSGYYVYDLNGSNFYNSSEGNIYANVMNSSIQVVGLVNSINFPNLKIGTNGSGYPYGHSTSDTKFYCDFVGCADYAPLTPTLMELGNLSVICGVGGTCTGNATNFIIPMTINITATPATSYVFSNWSVVSGVCTINNASANTTVTVTSSACVVQSAFTAIPAESSVNIILALIAIVVAVVLILLILNMSVTIENLIAVLVISIIVIQMIIPYLLNA